MEKNLAQDNTKMEGLKSNIDKTNKYDSSIQTENLALQGSGKENQNFEQQINIPEEIGAKREINKEDNQLKDQKQEEKKIMSEADLENILLEKKIITKDQLDVALKEKKDKGSTESIGNILVNMGLITDSMLGEVLSSQTGSENFDLKSSIIDQRLVHKVPKGFALQNKVIPVSFSRTTVTVAISDLYDIITLDQIKRFFPSQFKIIPVYATETDILKAIDQYYDYEMSIDGILKEIESGNISFNEQESMQGNYKSPMVRLVDALLTDAVRIGASDLHFEPEDFFLRLRYRIDGKMEQVRTFHNKYWASIAVRIKIMSGMNIAETRKPQDGRIQSIILGRNIDFRVSCHPTVAGENIVMRILDEKQAILSLKKLGFVDDNINLIKKCIKKPEGVVILTGPTGCGKTTTLYTLLNMINNVESNIMTLENPVEYRLPLIRQSNINPEIGVTFAEGIRTLLRQDPDVILVGEVRDEETAIAAVQAAMTGHQVYTSLHTNDAFSAIPRLMQIGVKPYLLSGSLTCIVAQRLARAICPCCKEEYQITKEEKDILVGVLGEEEAGGVEKLYRGVGCEKCRGKGYIKRTAIAEVLDVDKEIDDMIVREARKKEMLSYLDKKGFITMQVDGVRKVIKGITTLEELIRCVDMTAFLKV
ncbi:MAG TPA: GspE/PulE family protein [Rickettsiales bacterium]|nr:GspE/PulE family protein [Rickettsiales bacterium]